MNTSRRVFVFMSIPFSLSLSSRAAPSKLQAIDRIFDEYDCADVPGASAMVIRDGKVLFKKAYGLANLEENIPSTTRTNYRLASLTKQFTAMTVMILAERRRLSLMNRLTDFFPDFPAYGTQINVRHLLNHTSGLIAYEDLIPDVTTVPLKDKDVLRLIKRQDRTYFTPGTQYRYSNSGYALLALIVEAVSNISFAEFLKRNIFDPLGMTGTVAYEKDISTVRHRAYGYTQRGKLFEKTDQSLTSSVLGDGGIYSSVEDLYKWDQALYTARLVSSETLTEIFTTGVSTDEAGTGYGYGWFISNRHGQKTVWHYGDTIGFSTAIERIPDRRLMVIILVNRSGVSATVMARQIAGLYLMPKSSHP
jgi:CubicO group peptidase (beta-lactamase class C family)